MKSVYCAVRTGSLNKAVCASYLKTLLVILVRYDSKEARCIQARRCNSAYMFNHLHDCILEILDFLQPKTISIFILAIDGVLININICLSVLIVEIKRLFLYDPKLFSLIRPKGPVKWDHKIYFVPDCITDNFNAEDT